MEPVIRRLLTTTSIDPVTDESLGEDWRSDPYAKAADALKGALVDHEQGLPTVVENIRAIIQGLEEARDYAQVEEDPIAVSIDRLTKRLDDMETHIDRAGLESVAKLLNKMNLRLEDVAKMGERLKAMDNLNTRFEVVEKMDTRLQAIEAHIEAVQLDKLIARLESMDARIEATNSRITAAALDEMNDINARFDTIDNQLTSMGSSMEAINDHIEAVALDKIHSGLESVVSCIEALGSQGSHDHDDTQTQMAIVAERLESVETQLKYEREDKRT
ncbi:hypothetical protein N0V90_003582 [Kalmusia sp. IMI 367209]|nr:hypothetical protein N0V90_003582 [Kalmusia sp. IMI 367209]